MCLAIPAKVVYAEDAPEDTALVDVVGVRRFVNIGLLRDVALKPGDWVLVHVGFAMSRISEAEAREQLRLLTELGESDAARTEAEGYDAERAESYDASEREAAT